MIVEDPFIEDIEVTERCRRGDNNNISSIFILRFINSKTYFIENTSIALKKTVVRILCIIISYHKPLRIL